LTNPIVGLRIAAYLSLVILVFAVQFAIRNSMPMVLLTVPSLAGLNLLVWRNRYRGEPAVPQLNAVMLQRNELRERIRVMDSQVQEIDSEKREGQSRRVRPKSSHRKRGQAATDNRTEDRE
jgi:hypothetical protein